MDAFQLNERVINNIRKGIVVYGPDLRYRVWNSYMETFTGMKARDVLGRLPLEVFPFLKDGGVMDALTDALESGAVRSVEFPFRVWQTGHAGWAEDCTAPLYDANGEIIGIIGTVTDITERKHADEALKASEQRFRDIVNTTDGIVWEADATTFTFTFVSDKAERLLGYPAEDWLQPGFWVEHLHPDDKAWAPGYCLECTQRLEPHDFEYRFIARDGRTVWLHDIVTVVGETGAPRWLRGIMVDITARRQAEEQLREITEGLEKKVVERTGQLRKLSATLTMTEERERRILAQELHDNLGQLLAVIKIKLTSMAAGAPQASIDQIVGLVDQADHAARTITQQLSPPLLHTLGLIPALEWLADEIERVYGVKVHVDHDDCRRRLVDEVQAVLYRAVRELLINVARHAGVNEASLSCLCDAGRLMIVVSDAGAGFDAAGHFDAWPDHPSFGLKSVYERLVHIGGEMDVDSTPGHGTTITLSVPRSINDKEICNDPNNACR